MRRVYRDNGYQEISCPQILDRSLWEKSGHWENYKDNMFTTESEKRDFADQADELPGPRPVFNSDLRSYRDLPLRYGEFAPATATSLPGALHGIMRVRGFTQDDGHIFCKPEQIEPECVDFHKLAFKVYGDFGFKDIAVKIALRPDKRIGEDHQWDRAERALRAALRACWAHLGGAAGRGRLLRAQDRVPPQGLDRPQLAGGHDAGRLHDAGAPGRGVRGRGQHAQRSRSCCTAPSWARWSASSAS
jgi:threonyl-tRNA synthetase